jgi:hypothetical protein
VLRTGTGLATLEVPDLTSLRRVAPELGGAVDAACAGRGPLLAGFRVYNLDERRPSFRLLRLP